MCLLKRSYELVVVIVADICDIILRIIFYEPDACLTALCSLLVLRLLSDCSPFALRLLFACSSFALRLFVACSLLALRVAFVSFTLRMFFARSLFALLSSIALGFRCVFPPFSLCFL